MEILIWNDFETFLSSDLQIWSYISELRPPRQILHKIRLVEEYHSFLRKKEFWENSNPFRRYTIKYANGMPEQSDLQIWPYISELWPPRQILHKIRLVEEYHSFLRKKEFWENSNPFWRYSLIDTLNQTCLVDIVFSQWGNRYACKILAF